MRTVETWWKAFEQAVVPATAGPLQRNAMRQSFYGGFYACIEASGEIADTLGEEKGAEAIQTLYAECLEFASAEARRDSH